MADFPPYLMHGDCLELMRQVPNGFVDLVLCDLPYGTTQNKWDAVIPFEPLWEQYRRICRGAVVLFAANPFASLLVSSNMKQFRYDWVWKKNAASGHLNAKKMPMRDHELVLVFGKENYNPQMGEGKPYKWASKRSQRGCYGDHGDAEIQNNGTRHPRTVLQYDIERGLHPTQKPVPLLEYLVRTYTNEGDVVLDNTMGSGTTGVACVNTKRCFIGMEKDENYFSIASKRIGEAQANAQ